MYELSPKKTQPDDIIKFEFARDTDTNRARRAISSFGALWAGIAPVDYMTVSPTNPALQMACELSALEIQPNMTARRMSLSHRSRGDPARQSGGRRAVVLARVDFAARIGKVDPTAVHWRRMVIYPDPTGAVCKAVTSLYRKAWKAAGRPQDAQLYMREVVGVTLLYFSPRAAQFSEKIFEVFPADRTAVAPDLENCFVVQP